MSTHTHTHKVRQASYSMHTTRDAKSSEQEDKSRLNPAAYLKMDGVCVCVCVCVCVDVWMDTN